MTNTGAVLADIDDPLVVPGWRVSRPDDEGMLHAEVLRELCDRGLALHVGAAGTRGVGATLQFVDTLRQQLVLASGRQVGEIRSVAVIPGLAVSYSLALMEAQVAFPGTELDVSGIRASIVAKPFLRRRS